MTNPPENPAGPPRDPNGPSGPPPGSQPPQGPPSGTPQGPPPQGPPPQGPPPQGPPPGWQQPGPPPGWQPPHNQPVWQGHQAPQQWGHAWQQPTPKKRTGLVVGLVLVALLLIGGAVAAVVLAAANDEGADVLAVSDLEEGMCLTSDDLAQGNDEVDDMTEAECDDEHDAKVFAVLTVEEGESFAAAGSRCAEELGDDFDTLRDAGIEVRPLAEDSEPEKDDDVVCFLRHEDGDPLDQDVV